MWALLFLVALVFSLYSLILAWISSFLIHSYCIMCIVSYGINFALLFYTWLVLRRFALGGFFDELKADLRYLAVRSHRFGLIFGLLAASAVALWLWMPDYWKMQNPVPASSFSSGVTPEGHPWIGAEQAEIEIVEFTDYRCFQCRKMNYFLRGLMARYPDKIRVVHRHFPMDHQVNPLVKGPLHVGAGALAMMSIYAAEQGRFWEMHDLLFSMGDEQEIGTRDLAQSVGLDPVGLARSLRNTQILRKLRDDMTAGYKLGVTGTPTYVIEGRVYDGQLPPNILSRIRN
jgi:protein-disulfide isomerase